MEDYSWEVIFYETARGEKVVKEFIKTLEVSTISKISSEIDLLKDHGPFLGMPHSRKLMKDLYELRIRGRQEVRIVYGFINKTVILLHIFVKKTQETPPKEVETALKRLLGLK